MLFRSTSGTSGARCIVSRAFLQPRFFDGASWAGWTLCGGQSASQRQHTSHTRTDSHGSLLRFDADSICLLADVFVHLPGTRCVVSVNNQFLSMYLLPNRFDADSICLYPINSKFLATYYPTGLTLTAFAYTQLITNSYQRTTQQV